jgi:hypothetical protein
MGIEGGVMGNTGQIFMQYSQNFSPRESHQPNNHFIQGMNSPGSGFANGGVGPIGGGNFAGGQGGNFVPVGQHQFLNGRGGVVGRKSQELES